MAERTAEDWGRVAMRIPGWHESPSDLPSSWLSCPYDLVPDPDHWAWEGWFLRLLGPQWSVWSFNGEVAVTYCEHQTYTSTTLGRACIAAAEALGRWPGGSQ